MRTEPEIVERLRSYARNCGGPPEDYLTWQAADEIERLTKQCEGLAQAAMNNGQDLLLQEAEIERLRDMIDNRNEFIAERGLWRELGQYLSEPHALEAKS